jgi:hypothetical protein
MCSIKYLACVGLNASPEREREELIPEVGGEDILEQHERESSSSKTPQMPRKGTVITSY